MKLYKLTPLIFCLLLKTYSSELKLIPQFKLPSASGKIYTNSDLNGRKGVIIVLLSNHCRISQKFDKYLNSNYIFWKQKGLNLFVFSPNNEKAIIPSELAYSEYGDSLDEMELKVSKKKIIFPYIYDGSDQIISTTLNAKVTPSVYLFNKERELVYTGRIGNHQNISDEKNFDLNKKINQLIENEEIEFSKTSSFGTNIRLKKDLLHVEEINRRYSKETVNIHLADERKINLIIKNNLNQPLFFYVWKIDNQTNLIRANLNIISKNFKIFRKRGIKFYTVCILNKGNEEKALELLKYSSLSSYNYYVYPNQQTALMKLTENNWVDIYPFCRLIKRNGEYGYAYQGKLDDFKLRSNILKAIEEK